MELTDPLARARLPSNTIPLRKKRIRLLLTQPDGAEPCCAHFVGHIATLAVLAIVLSHTAFRTFLPLIRFLRPPYSALASEYEEIIA